jgi:hypothetical protein
MASGQNSLSISADHCDLRVALELHTGSIRLVYEFRNRSGNTAFLFNLLFRDNSTGSPVADSNLVYVVQSGNSITLSKKVIPVPGNMLVEKPEIPFLTRVDAGQVFRESLSIPLPLRLYSPYSEETASSLGEAPVSFELGFFLAPDPSVVTSQGGNLVIDPFPPERQKVLRAGPLGRLPVSPR